MRETILVVGDVAGLTDEVAEMLGRVGHAVVLAPRPHGSVVMTRGDAPAMVVICLPLVGVIEERVLHLLRCYGADTPLLVVGRELRDVERSRLIAAGADRVLVLGADPAPLLAMVASARRRPRDGRARRAAPGSPPRERPIGPASP